ITTLCILTGCILTGRTGLNVLWSIRRIAGRGGCRRACVGCGWRNGGFLCITPPTTCCQQHDQDFYSQKPTHGQCPLLFVCLVCLSGFICLGCVWCSLGAMSHPKGDEDAYYTPF